MKTFAIQGQSLYYDNKIFTSVDRLINNKNKLPPLIIKQNGKKARRVVFRVRDLNDYMKNSSRGVLRYATIKDWQTVEKVIN